MKQNIKWIIAVVGLILIFTIYGYIKYSKLYPSTDDAYVQANIINMATQVSGPVENIYVIDHQFVKQGQLLFSIDPKPFQIAVAQAEALLTQHQAELTKQSKDTARILQLVNDGQLPKANGDDAQGLLDIAKATLKAAENQLAQAQLNLNYTQITAPANGYLVNFLLRKGQIVQAGNPLFALVEDGHWWVDANFKETDMQRIQLNQNADIKVDMYPNLTFRGIVKGISAGSGSAFALLPPENATGNWVKVTQRFPVRIEITDKNPTHPLRIGMSTTVTVNTLN